MTIVFYVLFAAAFIGWLATVAMTATLHESDQAGNGLTYSFATLGAGITWILLAALMVLSFRGADAPAWSKIAALVGVPLSGVTAVVAIQMLKDRSDFPGQWPIAMVVAPALLMFAFALWTKVDAVRELVGPEIAFPSVWSTVILLSVFIYPFRIGQQATLDEKRKSAMQQSAADALSEQQLWQLKFDSLGSSSHLREVLAFHDNGSNMRDAALALARTLPNRQHDAIEMLSANEESVMSELRNLELNATPQLCDAATEFLRKHAVNYRGRVASDNDRFVVAAQFLEKYLFGMQWLAERGCDMTAATEAYRETAAAYPDSPERATFLSRLESLTSTAAQVRRQGGS